ncbi:uncharacterized protein LOC132703822 [Cylas formicarius]|uniref:uncharacterized protein LOC132703822 n=1 Tax=Cylas formicarius TaxID=197179 RepID=UPI002958B6C1|nr:uncharacterized protein LOC132703822 [Cylas formicarius]
MKVPTVVYLLCYFLNNDISVSGLNDYYWKDYTGKVPEDAVPGGTDMNQEKVYIGQAFLQKEGIFPTTIYPGDKTVYVPWKGAKKSQEFIQILCSRYPDSDAFKWTSANKTHLHLTTVNDHLIRGGIEDQKWLFIGRVKYQGQIVIGKVLQGNVGNAIMYFAHDGNEHNAPSYEVLKFDNSVFIEPRLN